jgi:hypothetical protein
MVGQIQVEPVILDGLPTAAVPAGNQVEFDGRTADPAQPVQIERVDGTNVQTVATATPASDGTWKANVTAQSTGDYRATNTSGSSETRHLIVSDRKIVVRATRRGINVSVMPSLPYGRIELQEDLRQRFGWWPAQRTRLDYVSEASFKVARPARLRVALVDKDGWTVLSMSPIVTLGHVTYKSRDQMPGTTDAPASGNMPGMAMPG